MMYVLYPTELLLHVKMPATGFEPVTSRVTMSFDVAVGDLIQDTI